MQVFSGGPFLIFIVNRALEIVFGTNLLLALEICPMDFGIQDISVVSIFYTELFSTKPAMVNRSYITNY